MTDSATTKQDPTTKRRVLVTGAAGRIGGNFWRDAADRYSMRLAHRSLDNLTEAANAGQEVIALDVADLDACRVACKGIDTVLHLAADPSPAADFYGTLLESNIKGTFNIFQAAQDQGCQRVIFASSIHAVIGYPEQAQPRTDDAVRPNNMYGVTKVFGEAVASRFAAHGLSSIAIRIGAYHARGMENPNEPENRSMFVSPRDLNQLMTLCIEAQDIDFAIVNGLSNNRFLRMDLVATKKLLGYAPQDDAFALFGAE